MSGSIEEALEVPRWSIDLTIRVILDAARIAVSMNYFNHYEQRENMHTNLKDRYATYVVHLTGSGLPVKPFSQWLVCYS